MSVKKKEIKPRKSVAIKAILNCSKKERIIFSKEGGRLRLAQETKNPYDNRWQEGYSSSLSLDALEEVINILKEKVVTK